MTPLQADLLVSNKLKFIGTPVMIMLTLNLMHIPEIHIPDHEIRSITLGYKIAQI